MLKGFDTDLVSQLVEVTRAIGIDVRTRAEVFGIEKADSAFQVRVQSAAKESTIECGLVVHAAGRVADLDNLDLDAADVKRTEKGVVVNEYLQSVSNPAVYAAGDSVDNGGLPLTPMAATEGDIVARNLLDGNRHVVDVSGLASIVYTVPSLGMTGLAQTQAAAHDIRFSIHDGDSTGWYSSRRVRARRSAYRLLVEDDTNYILGAHVLGPHTEELVNVFSLAIRERIPAERLQDVLFAYPTASSDIKYMLE